MNHGLKIRISKRSQEIHSYQITTLATHHHWDHTGGIKNLASENPNMSVIGKS